MKDQSEYRDKLINTGNRAAEILLTTDENTGYNTALMDSMELIGIATGVDRVQIWRNEMVGSDLCFVKEYEWESEDSKKTTAAPIGKKFPYKDRLGWESMFSSGGCINDTILNLSESDKEFFNAYDVKSVAFVPLFLNNSFWGFFGLVDCKNEHKFTDDEITVLRSLSLMLASAVNRNDQALKIREAHEHAKLLLDAMPLSCHLWDKNLNIFDFNEANIELFGTRDKEEFINRYSELSPEYQPDGQLSSVKAANYVSKTFSEGFACFEWMHQTLDGTPIPCEITLKRINYDGEYVVAAYLRDLREQKRMLDEISSASLRLEEALDKARNANNAKSEFLANMSHEMRTPMNAIIGLSELMLGDESLPQEVSDNLDKIYSAGSTLLSIINNILDISKIESGKFELIPVEFDLPSFINDTIVFNIMRIGEKLIEFKLIVDEALPCKLIGDDVRLKQICNNLISNAIKYTKSGFVEWRISYEREEGAYYGWLIFRVSDSGIGIRPEDIKKLFSDYSQVDTKSNRKIEGTGLGLSLTKQLVEMMGGNISVESEYGKGSVFTARLKVKHVTDVPLGAGVIKSLQEFNYSERKLASQNKLVRIKLPYAKVLVVDDVSTNLDVARGMMKPYEMQIDCVSSGQEAIDKVLSENVKYNAIFMDHMMPDMDGIETTRIIREEIATDYARNVPIIALTANAIAGNDKMFLEKGFNAFLSKPIDTTMLDTVIRRWVRDKKLEKQLKNDPCEEKVNANKSRLCKYRNGKSIKGVDIEGGVRRFGSEEVYLEVLQSFASNTPELLDQLAEVTKNTLSDYSVIVHGIKGSARSVCLNQIGDLAEKLEDASKEGDYSYVSENNPGFIREARILISKITGMLKDLNTDNKLQVRPEPDPAVLSSLKEACEAFDIDGVDKTMAELEKYEYEKGTELIGWLKENVKIMGFQNIVSRLSANQGEV